LARQARLSLDVLWWLTGPTVDKSSIRPGEEYGVREPPRAGVELQHVKVIEHVRADKWRAEWIDPNPGLVDYIKSQNIVVAWTDRRALLSDERHAVALDTAVTESGFPGEQHPTTSAVQWVLDTTGESQLWVHHGVLRFEPGALERVAHRAGVAVPTHPAGYRDRYGFGHLPWECAVDLAMRFAGAEPRTVLDSVDSKETEWSNEVRHDRGHHLVGVLNEYRASWALIRQWAGLDAAIAIREERITMLERTLSDVRWDLKRPNPDLERIVTRIERALR
jgi:hypothetical protein